MAVSYVGQTSGITGTGTATFVSANFNGGTLGVQVGDLLMAVVCVHGETSGSVTPPSGWTYVADASGDSTDRCFLYYKWATSSDTSGVRVNTWQAPFARNWIVGIVIVRGVDPDDPFEAVDTYNAVSSTTIETGEVDTDAGQMLAVFYAGMQTSSGREITPHPSMVERFDRQNSNGRYVMALATEEGLEPAVDVSRPGELNSAVQRKASWLLKFRSDNNPPHAPIVTNPAPGQTFARGETNRVQATFSDPDPGDSPSRMIGEVRLDGESEPYYSWDVESPNQFHDIGANELSLGVNELRIQYADASGVLGPFCDWVPFNVADRSGPPTITTPTPGSTIGAQQATVVWSAAAQEAYRLRKREDDAGEPGDIIEGSDTGIVSSAAARSRVVSFPTNNVHEWVEVARLVDGLWSDYDPARYEIAYTPPATPTVTVTLGEGVLTVTVEHPTPVGDQPAVTHMHIWRRTADESPSEDPQSPRGAGVRLQEGSGLAPSASFVDGSVAGGVIYEYRVEAVGSNEVASFSDWTG